MGIEYRVEEMDDRDIAILRITGEMDFDVRSEFQTAVNQLVASAQPKLVIDLSRIARMSSVFIGTLIDHASQISQNGKILSVMMKERVAETCRKAGLDKVVHIVVV